jgi:DNA transformation protein and related proteins
MSGDRDDKPSARQQRRAPAQPAATGPAARAAQADHSGLGLDLGTPISSLPNLGPASEAQFAAAGIHSAEALRALGADAAYAALLAAGTRPHFIGYYVLHMALQGRPWNDCKGAEKAALRASFDTLKTAHQRSDSKANQELEAALQFFGVVPKRT